MKGCLEKNLMKKPAAARKKKKRSACMKMRKEGRWGQKIFKRPSMQKMKRSCRNHKWREVAAHAYAALAYAAAVSSVAVPDLHECATFSP